ncbi:hypothetical protein GCM10020221_34600 [Streptomyces thioluteus]|uniref:Uncharacterized protein n=1 Tax=Streptomyces thioluteus TaxID=66431 RepID=A0ABN3X5L2_STRTU
MTAARRRRPGRSGPYKWTSPADAGIEHFDAADGPIGAAQPGDVRTPARLTTPEHYFGIEPPRGPLMDRSSVTC